MRAQRDVGLAIAVAVAIAPSSCAPPASAPASPSSAPSISAVPVPEPPTPTAVPVESQTEPAIIVVPDYEPPQPACPAPLLAVAAPTVTVRVGDAGPQMPASMGSSSVMTCSTAASSDVGEISYPAPLVARADDVLMFRVDDAWRILWFEEHDFPKVGDGANLTPGVRLSDPRVEVTIPVPRRGGEMIVSVTMWVFKADGRAVARIEPSVWVSAP